MSQFFAACFSICLFFSLSARTNEALQRRLMEILADRKALVGVAVIIDGKDTVTVNNEIRYPMMSVFKFHQALAVADYLEKNRIPLDSLIYISPASLRPDTYSPLRDKYPQGDIRISIRELLIYTLQQSDNNACDILFEQMVGVGETDAYIRSLGIDDFSIVATEEDMHREVRLCYENWTTPLAVARLLDLFVSCPGFLGVSGSFVRRTMMECKTGLGRLMKPLAGKEVIVGHKTGTSDADVRGRWIGINDVGFVFLPDGHRYTIAVMTRDSGESFSDTEQIIADISEAVYLHLTP